MLRSIFLTLGLLQGARTSSVPPPCDATEEICVVHDDDDVNGTAMLQSKHQVRDFAQNRREGYQGPWVLQTDGEYCYGAEIRTKEECTEAGNALGNYGETQHCGSQCCENCNYDVAHGCSVSYKDRNPKELIWNTRVGSRPRRYGCTVERPCLCRDRPPLITGTFKGSADLDEYITKYDPGLKLWDPPSGTPGRTFAANQIKIKSATMGDRQVRTGAIESSSATPPTDVIIKQVDSGNRFARFKSHWFIGGRVHGRTMKWIIAQVYIRSRTDHMIYIKATKAGSLSISTIQRKHLEETTGEDPGWGRDWDVVDAEFGARDWNDIANQLFNLDFSQSGYTNIGAFHDDNGLGVDGIRVEIRGRPGR